MRIFRTLSIISVLVTYLLIFLGGLARICGSDMGCPDWPDCICQLLPPNNVDLLAAKFDPIMVNFTLVWIEYLNRLVSITLGLIVAVLAIWAIIRFIKNLKILIPSVTAALLLALQAWQGNQITTSPMEPLMVSVHLILAFIIVSLLINVSQQSYYIDNPDTEKNSVYSNKAQAWLIVIWVFSIIQIILGTQLRAAMELAIKHHQLLLDQAMISNVGAVKYVHPLFGILTSFFIIIITRRLMSPDSKPSSLVRRSSKTLQGLTIIQLIIGMIIVLTDLPQIARLMHLCVTGLMIGLILIIYTALSHNREVTNTQI